MNASDDGARDTAVSVFVSPADTVGLNGLSQRTILGDLLRDFRDLKGCDIYVHTDRVHEDWVREKLPDDNQFILELGGPAGRRGLPRKVQDQLNRHFENGYENVMALAADTPGLGAWTVEAARRQLKTSNETAVVGPSGDGGFYLLGLNRPCRDLLEEVPFYVENTYRCLRRKLDENHSRVRSLEPLRDVDQVSDWFHVRNRWLDPYRWLLRIIHRVRCRDVPRRTSRTLYRDADVAYLSRKHRSPPLAA